MRHLRTLFTVLTVLGIGLCRAGLAGAQPPTGQVGGFVADETGGALPGVTIELQNKEGGEPIVAVTGAAGEYTIGNVPPGKYDVWFSMIGFGRQVRRDIEVGRGMTRAEAVMHLALSAEVTVSGKRTFVNLADAEDPAQDLMGIAEIGRAHV